MARPTPQQQPRPPSPPRQSQPRQQQQKPQLPFNLLCCPNALPHTLTYLATLLSSTATHHPFQKPLTLGPLLTPFLVLLATSTSIPQPSKIATFNPYTVLIQVTRCVPLLRAHPTQVQSVIQQGDSEPRYFGQLTPDAEAERNNTAAGGPERVKERLYLEVGKGEAERILRFPGSGGEGIGDGEIWTRVKGWEKTWCEDCSIWWEFRVWVREL